MNFSTCMNFVVALAAEAHPIVGHFKLKRIHSVSSFEVYRNENIQLIVCGIGKINAAAAAGFLTGLAPESAMQAWLNVGIAGGDSAEFGDAVVASEIVDLETRQKFYPSLCFDHGMAEVQIATINKPSNNYLEHTLYDMEASGYFAAASRFSTLELVHSCKIVSDNSEQCVDKIDKELAINLIQSRLDKIEYLTECLMNMARQLEADERIEIAAKQVMAKHHFTESQKNTLKLYLQNWFALNKDSSIEAVAPRDSENSRAYLQFLKNLIDSVSVRY